MSAPTSAVFLSYASEDVAAAERIATSLRDAGIEVWFDKNELVGGDSWDAKIRRQIQECTLFLPIVSTNTQARTEGYFRLEWRLAEQRTHLMAKGRPFLVPVVIDDTHDSDAHVPDAFLDVQWSRYPEGEVDDRFAERVKELLKGEVARPGRRRNISSKPADGAHPSAKSRTLWWLWLAGPAFAFGLFVAVAPLFQSNRENEPESTVTDPSQELVERARHLLDTGDHSLRENLVLAGELLEQAQQADPLNAEAWARHAQLTGQMMNAGHLIYEEGLPLLSRSADRAMQLDPDSLESQLAHGWKLWARRQTLKEAEKLLTTLSEQYPEDGRAFLLRGMVAYRQYRNPEAMKWFDRAIEDPRLAVQARTEKALRQFIIGDFSGAELTVEESLALQPTGAALLIKIRGQVLWQGDLAGARTTLAQVPSSLLLEDRGAFNAFRVHWWSGDATKALHVARDVSGEMMHDNQYPGPRSVLLATAYEMSGLPEIAQVEWQRALDIITPLWNEDPADRTYNYLRCLCLVRLNRPDEALEAIDLAARLSNMHHNMWPGGGLAGLLHDLGENERALELLDQQMETGAPLFHSRAVLSLNPDLADFREDPRFQGRIARAPGPISDESDLLATSAIPENSIAVLAFANRSADADNEYFSDGISEELLNVLTRIEGLKVTARTSAFHFKGKDTPIREIGRQLGVAYIVEGSVRRVGNRVRITTQLIKAEDGFNVWSETFDRELKDIFAVQDEIAGLVANELQLKLGFTSPTREVNPEAYGLFLQARELWNQRGEDNFIRAEAALNRALELDPDFAEAHATMADIWAMRATYWSYQGKADTSEEIAKTRASANHALSLNPDLSRPYSALGWACMLEGKWEESRRWHRQAIERSPRDAMTRFWYGSLLAQIGEIEASERELQFAAELDPLSFIITLNLGFYGYIREDWQESYDYYRKGAQLREGGFIPALSGMANSAYGLGRTEEAVRLSRKVLASWPELPRFSSDQFAVWVLHKSGHETEAEAFVESVMPELPPSSYIRGFLLAAIGRWEEALPNFETTPYAARGWVFDSPILDPWRDDPRFLAMIDRWGETERYQQFRAALLDYRKK